MINPFPQLLDYGFFAPTLLRTAAACMLFYIAWRVSKGAARLASTPFPLVGKTRPWVMQLAAGATALIGSFLLVGFATQWDAILGALVALKLMWFQSKLEPVVTLQNATYILLLVICLSLLATGAGALAVDLPL